MTKRALQLSLSKIQNELTRTRNMLIRENAKQSIVDVIEKRILSIKKTRYELSSRSNKDSACKDNISFGKYFWNKDNQYVKNTINSFFLV